MPSSFYPNHFVPLHKRSVTKIVGIQTFLADGNNVAISQERQYAIVWTREDSHLCHKMSKPRLLIIVSFAGHPLTLMFRPSILRQLHNPPTPDLQIFFSLIAKYLLLYRRKFLSTQTDWMWQTGLLRPICLSVLRQGQGTFVMQTRVPYLSVAQLSLLVWYKFSSASELYRYTPRLSEALQGLLSYRHLWLMATRCY